MASPNHGYIGQRVLRREDDRLVRGRAAYLDDLPELPGTVHLSFVRSPNAHALIRSIDTSAAKSLPGVMAVLTGVDMRSLSKPFTSDYDQPGWVVTEWPVLAVEEVRFAGEAVAVVVASDPYVAEDGAELVEVEYEMLPAVVDAEEAVAPGAPLVHGVAKDNVLYRGAFKSRGFDEAFRTAEYVIEDTFRSSRVAAVPIEPRGSIATYDDGEEALTLWSSTQIPHLLRAAVSELLGFPETKVRVLVPEVGGGFGMKAHVYPEEIVVAALARKLLRPVKWVQDRLDDLLTSTHARDHVFNVAAAVNKDGVLQAIRANITVNVGAYSVYPWGCSLDAAGGALMLPGPYKLGEYAHETRAVSTHTCPAGAYRGVAQPSAFFAVEGLMDRIAHALGLDPAEVRLRNLLKIKDFPYVNVVGIRYDTGRYVDALKRALELAQYDKHRREAASASAEGTLRGLGIACITEHTGQGASRYRARGLKRVPGYDSAHVKIEPDGKAIAFVSQAAAGQGHVTTYAQIAADYLGLKVDDVIIKLGDTQTSPHGTGTFASRGVVTAGGALARASTEIREKIRRIAGHVLEVSPVDIEVKDGNAYVAGAPQLKISMQEVAAIAHSADRRELPQGESFGLEAINFYDPPYTSISFAVHIALVELDEATCLARLTRYVVVHDCGRVVNPTIVEGQLHGAIAQGVGQALMEAIVYNREGQLISAHLLDYVLPTALDIPDIVVEHLETPSLDTVGGFKGVGENGIIGAVPAIANAVGDALSKRGGRVNQLPLHPTYLANFMY